MKSLRDEIPLRGEKNAADLISSEAVRRRFHPNKVRISSWQRHDFIDYFWFCDIMIFERGDDYGRKQARRYVNRICGWDFEFDRRHQMTLFFGKSTWEKRHKYRCKYPRGKVCSQQGRFCCQITNIPKRMLRNGILDWDCAKSRHNLRRYCKNYFSRLRFNPQNVDRLHQHSKGKCEINIWRITE